MIAFIDCFQLIVVFTPLISFSHYMNGSTHLHEREKKIKLREKMLR